MVGDRDGYRAAPRDNCQELRGEIKAAPIFRRAIVGTRDSVFPATTFYLSECRRMEGGVGFGLIGSVSLCHRNLEMPLRDLSLSLSFSDRQILNTSARCVIRYSGPVETCR